MPADAPTESTVLAYIDTLSNWGRWGPDDTLGTLNLITDEYRLRAAQKIATGRTVSAAWNIEMNLTDGIGTPPQRWMRRTGLGWGDPNVPVGSRRPTDEHMASASEFISMVFHGFTITHLDCLSHVHWHGQMYGGRPSADVTDWEGATVHDVISAKGGIQSRGVLLDIPLVQDRTHLEPGEAVLPEHLEAAEKRLNVRVTEGDILLVRTGNGLRRSLGTWDPPVEGWPGLHAACLPWIRERGIAVLGADVPQDVNPSGYASINLPIHAIGMAAMGLWLIDNCELETLRAACTEMNRWSFFLSVLPLPMRGATGSPVNPIAIF